MLASMRGKLFRDEDFAELYCADNGRDSVPPSLLATALLLQTHDRASDAGAKQRADFDIRWKVALGIEVEDRPFARSTIQLFRARLILQARARDVFEHSLRFARESGYIRGRRMKVALDTTYKLGRGAVKNTHNLLADGTVKLMGALSELEESDPAGWATANGYHRYMGSSVKGEACIDWDDRTARSALLGEMVRLVRMTYALPQFDEAQALRTFPSLKFAKPGRIAEVIDEVKGNDVLRRELGTPKGWRHNLFDIGSTGHPRRACILNGPGSGLCYNRFPKPGTETAHLTF